MSVVKNKRKESQFEVLHHFYKVRAEVTHLMLYDFGWRRDRQEQKLLRQLQIDDTSKLSGSGLERWQKFKRRSDAFCNWFITDQRQTIMNCLRDITENIFVANSIYPTCREELAERRVHQDRAIGQCHRLIQELQYVITTLEVDINRYTRLADMITEEINLIKGWRKANSKFKVSF